MHQNSTLTRLRVATGIAHAVGRRTQDGILRLMRALGELAW
jgi:hypothetical protein